MRPPPVEIERLRPHEIEVAVTQRSIIYLPLGTYEWHGAHLPIGLDALTAHGICIRSAQLDGGLVCPPLYYGTGGGHSRYPWTVMMGEDAPISAMLEKTLTRMREFGVKLVVLFSGHFAPTQIEMIDRVARDWNASRSPMRCLALAVNGATHLPFAPDHAAIFETTLLHALWPDLVGIDRLPPLATHPASDPGGDPFGPHRHDTTHPLYGIFGPDPRRFDPQRSGALIDAMVAWVVARVRAAWPGD